MIDPHARHALMAAVSIDPQRLRDAMDEAANRLDWLEPFRQRQYAQHPGLLLHLHRTSAGHVVLSMIKVEQRGQGIADRVLTELVAAADAAGDTLALSPTPEFGASQRRLTAWYTRHGFRYNRGRAKDYAISETMYRLPTRAVTAPAPPTGRDVRPGHGSPVNTPTTPPAPAP